MCQRPDSDDLPHHDWRCEACGAANSMWDAECQYCDFVKEEAPEEDPADYAGRHSHYS